MDIGIHVPNFTWDGGASGVAPTLQRLAAAAEVAGCYSFSVMDHFFQMEDFWPAEEPMLEAYTSLGFLAAHTERMKLRTLVTGVTYRHPGLLAKIVTTVDVLSGGRGELGVGAAWYEREHHGLGVPFPSVAERFERLEETLRICLQMWSDDDGPFDGRHYQLTETLCSPRPITRPHPPIMIGGGGEKKTLRFVAKYANACNLFTPSVDEVKKKLDVLRTHCEREGRDEAEIRKTVLYTGDKFSTGAFDALAAELDQYASLGIDEAIFMPVGDDAVEQVERLGELGAIISR